MNSFKRSFSTWRVRKHAFIPFRNVWNNQVFIYLFIKDQMRKILLTHIDDISKRTFKEVLVIDLKYVLLINGSLENTRRKRRKNFIFSRHLQEVCLTRLPVQHLFQIFHRGVNVIRTGLSEGCSYIHSFGNNMISTI